MAEKVNTNGKARYRSTGHKVGGKRPRVIMLALQGDYTSVLTVTSRQVSGKLISSIPCLSSLAQGEINDKYMSDVIKKDGKFIATRSIAGGDSMFIDSNVMDGMLEEQINDIKNPMPSKPLEDVFAKLKGGTKITMEVPEFEKMLRGCWAAALEYGAEQLMAQNMHECTSRTYECTCKEGWVECINKAKSSLLEEAKKALE